MDDLSPESIAHLHIGGKVHLNLMHFGRLLRVAGVPVGTGQILRAVEAISVVGVRRREDVYWALHAIFVHRQSHRELFDQAFQLFWRDPFGRDQAMRLLLPHSQVPEDEERPKSDFARRIQEAWQQHRQPGPTPQAPPPPEEHEEVQLDAAMTFSDLEILRSRDFEQMSADELRRAKAIIARMTLPESEVPTRRFEADARGRRIDMRRTLRASVRAGGHSIDLRWRAPRKRPPPLCVLCDISGSMERYSRMFLHFMHVLINDRSRVSAFVFGTRLSHVTRALKSRDIDLALARLGHQVQDWSGGTRITSCLKTFNRAWARRVLGQGAVVLLITDGLDRGGDPAALGAEVERLHLACRRLIWLNPLLRYEGFEPRAAGVQAMLPHVDDFRSIHNLESLSQLAEVLSAPPRPSTRRGRSASRP